MERLKFKFQKMAINMWKKIMPFLDGKLIWVECLID